ncbi:DUF3592 domain-containing protein [Vicingaceae bacterium]|nr:DUF3592 domain-containing protein [Vicingaceae bacterium]
MTGNVKLAFYAYMTFVVAIICATWVGFAIVNGNKTYDWQPTKAKVVKIGQKRGAIQRNTFAGFYAVVKYQFESKEYTVTLYDEYKPESETTVYVNPDDPSQIVADQGPQFRDMGIPVIVGSVALLFGIALVMIKLSPKEDA